MSNLRTLFNIMRNDGLTKPPVDFTKFQKYLESVFEDDINFKPLWKIEAKKYTHTSQCGDYLTYCVSKRHATLPDICKVALLVGVIARMDESFITVGADAFLEKEDIKKFDTLITDEILSVFRV